MIYLAAPYSHPDAQTRRFRYEKTSEAFMALMKSGVNVFSPLNHTVPMVEEFGLELSHEEYLRLDLEFLQFCDELLVLTLPHWRKSVGVMREVAAALRDRKPITLIESEDIPILPNVPKGATRFLKSTVLKEME